MITNFAFPGLISTLWIMSWELLELLKDVWSNEKSLSKHTQKTFMRIWECFLRLGLTCNLVLSCSWCKNFWAEICPCWDEMSLMDIVHNNATSFSWFHNITTFYYFFLICLHLKYRNHHSSHIGAVPLFRDDLQHEACGVNSTSRKANIDLSFQAQFHSCSQCKIHKVIC